MGKARDLARVIVDSGGLIAAGNLANAVPADGSITNAKIASVAASKLTGQVPDANAPSGSVIQVVEYTYNGGMSANGTGSAITPISGNITPSSASSKILAMFQATAGTSGGQMFGAWINRNGAQVGHNTTSTASYQTIANASMGSGYSAGDPAQTITGWVLDSPATTASTNYQLVMATRTDNGQGIRANWSWNYSSPTNGFHLPGMCKLILMEISG